MDSALGVFRKVTKFVGQMGLVGIALALTILQSQMFFTKLPSICMSRFRNTPVAVRTQAVSPRLREVPED